MNVYLARKLHPGVAQPEDDEAIQVRFFPLFRAVNMVMNGTVKDAKTISSILWLNHQRRGSKPRR
jgi:ADP-ribose pyrophosphatase